MSGKKFGKKQETDSAKPKESTDFYEILGVSRDCEQEDIKKAYKKLAMKWHPDKWGNGTPAEKKKAEEMFKKIANAAEYLTDEEKRAQYDRFGADNIDGEHSFQQSNGDKESQWRAHRDAFEMFNHFFGESGMSGMSGMRGMSGMMRGMRGMRGMSQVNIHNMRNGMHEVHVHNFQNNVNDDIHQQHNNHKSSFGKNSIDSDESEDEDDDEDEYCQPQTIKYDLVLSLEDLYKGTTKKFRVNKKTREGTVNEIVEVTIQPGWKEGTKITFEGKGDWNGDLIIEIKEKHNDLYKRDGNDILTTIDVTLDQAINGIDTKIKGLDGTEYRVNLPNGITQTSHIHPLKGKGMPIRKNGKVVGYGNILVGFNVILK